MLGATGDAVIGEVHLLAGGVSDSIFNGKAIDDALDRLRAEKPTRFRVEQRLPNATDGNLSDPGPETGTLDGRALAHLMRYCEDYVISCAIDVWRGNETARVEYRRGEISGVTVGGIDAPERLAEVMQWSSGNYRLVVPEFKLPATAPKRAKPATAEPVPVPAPAASAQAARQASSTKTIFGMPVAEVAKARAAAEAAKAAAEAARTARRPGPRVATPIPVAAPAPVAPHVTPPGVAPSATPAPMAAASHSATKTIFGVPAPKAPEGYVLGQRASQPGAPAVTAEADSARTETAKVDRKTGARKVDVPAPAIVATPAAAPRAPAAPISAPSAEPSEPQPTTQPGFDSKVAARKKSEPRRRARPRGEAAQAPPRDANLDVHRRRIRVRPGVARHLPALRPAGTLRRPACCSAVVDAYRRTRKPKDILWNKFVARPLAAVMIVPLARTRVTPNQVTLATLPVFLAGAALIAFRPGWGALCAGVAILELSYVLDCADGQLARLKGTSSPVGAHLDFLMDELKAFALVAAVAVRLWQPAHEGRWLLEGRRWAWSSSRAPSA